MPYRILPALLLACLVVFLPGCLKYKQVVTVNPDGSGKVLITVAMSEDALAMNMATSGADPFADFRTQELIGQERQGFVAFTQPVTSVADGYRQMGVTGYFEDIGELILGEDDGDLRATTFEHQPGQLTVKHGVFHQIANEPDFSRAIEDPEMRATVQKMIAGFELTEAYVLPGAVTEAGAFATQDNQASAYINAEMILSEQLTPLADQKDAAVVQVRYEGQAWSAGSQAQWAVELAAARAAWAELKAAATD